jgi:two-component sensor histidine kinase
MQEMQQRIQSMAQLHEMFYESSDQAGIDMKNYLSGLVDELRAAYRVSPGHIATEILVEPMTFGLETALPVGLIVNELVSNAFRHAFAGQRSGTVSVGLSPEAGGFVLEVSDDGIGLPAGFDTEKSRSLGWLLVHSLVIQLDGKLTLVSGPGTTARISAPLISRRSP